ncbi:hypothetical protein H0O02_03765 [Candidatus Micrarchaeota archaeon]|nr:hypothetical protein [Candidatus Micrarchaeota archaeon]
MGANGNGRGREISRQFVHRAESDEQIRRRARKNALKGIFRKTASESAAKVFGKRAPQVDIILTKENCTKEIAAGVLKLSGFAPEKLHGMMENFFNSVRLKDGGLKGGSQLASMLGEFGPPVKEKAIVCAIELLMATEDETLVREFVTAIGKTDPMQAITVLDGMNKIASIDYIHTMKACAEGFVKEPEKAALMIGKISGRIGARPSDPGCPKDEMLFSDIVIFEVVKEQLNL